MIIVSEHGMPNCSSHHLDLFERYIYNILQIDILPVEFFGYNLRNLGFTPVMIDQNNQVWGVNYSNSKNSLIWVNFSITQTYISNDEDTRWFVPHDTIDNLCMTNEAESVRIDGFLVDSNSSIPRSGVWYVLVIINLVPVATLISSLPSSHAFLQVTLTSDDIAQSWAMRPEVQRSYREAQRLARALDELWN